MHSGTHDTPDYIYEIVRACISSGQVVIRSFITLPVVYRCYMLINEEIDSTNHYLSW